MLQTLPYNTSERYDPMHPSANPKMTPNEVRKGRRPLERLRKLRAFADLRAEEVDEVDQGAESNGDESDGRHGPRGGHVLEHQDAEMRERCSHDEGGDEEGCDRGCSYIGVGV